MKHTESPQSGVNRRGFFVGLVSGLSVAALAAGASKARAAAGKVVRRGPILYRRTEEAKRYYDTMF